MQVFASLHYPHTIILYIIIITNLFYSPAVIPLLVCPLTVPHPVAPLPIAKRINSSLI